MSIRRVSQVIPPAEWCSEADRQASCRPPRTVWRNSRSTLPIKRLILTAHRERKCKWSPSAARTRGTVVSMSTISTIIGTRIPGRTILRRRRSRDITTVALAPPLAAPSCRRCSVERHISLRIIRVFVGRTSQPLKWPYRRRTCGTES